MQHRILALAASALLSALAADPASAQARTPWHKYSDAEVAQAVANLRRLDLPELPAERIDALAKRAAADALTANDKNLLCIGALAVPFGLAFGFGLVPNPPYDYVFGQLPAYATNLGLKFCPAELTAPPDIAIAPNVDTADGADCAYDFRQPIVEGGYSNFLGIPLEVLGDWTYGSTATSRGIGTPTVFHYNTDVSVRMVGQEETPEGYLMEAPPASLVATIRPGGIVEPLIDAFSSVGCRLDGTIELSEAGFPCPVDRNRKIRLPVGRHTISWRAETEIGLLDVLPPIYVPTQPPGSKKAVAKKILENAFKATGQAVVGSFLRSYPTGVVAIEEQVIDVFDTTVPTIAIPDPALSTIHIEALEPGGRSTKTFASLLRSGVVASDACNRPPKVVNNGILPFLPLGTHQVTWVASDAGPKPGGGVNSASVVQTVIVEDTLAPAIKAPPPVVVESATAPVAIDTGSPMVFDVADLEPVISRVGPATFPFGVTIVRWQATDASGNGSPQVEQKVTVKPVGSNAVPVAAGTSATGKSFDEIVVPLSASDANGDDLFFYIDEQPAEGFFVAPLLPTFVDDLRVARQTSITALRTHCETVNAPLPPQGFLYLPEYITVDDDGTSYVIDRELYCSGPGLPRNLFDRARIAKLSRDGALLGQYLFQSSTTIRKLSFHPGGLANRPQPFVYWVDRQTQRLLILDQSMTGAVEVLPLDALPPGTPTLNNHIDAAIDGSGILYVVDTIKLYAYDFLARNSSNAPAFLGRIAPTVGFGEAFDMDVDGAGNVYVGDRSRHRLYKFTASAIVRQPTQFTPGTFAGWMGRCDTDLAPGEAAVCNVALGRSFGFSCTDAHCGTVQQSGSLPGQFNQPLGFAIDPNDVLYVTDSGNQRIQRFTPEGLFAGQAKSDCAAVNCFVIGQFGLPNNVSVNSTSFFVLDQQTDILHIFSANPVTMTGPATGSVIYRSFNNFIGTDTFRYSASDGLRQNGSLVRSNAATASVQVAANQRAPFATPGLAGSGNEDTNIAIALDGSDADIGDNYPWEPLEALTFAIATQPLHGSVSVAGDTATYAPDPDWYGTDLFQFTTSDGTFASQPETVTVDVAPVNDAPALTAPLDPAALVAGLGYEYELQVGVRDPDDLDELSLQVDWGDGTTQGNGTIAPDGTITGPLVDHNASGDGVINAQRTYGQAGPRTVNVCAADAVGSNACIGVPIQVVPMTDLVVFEAGVVQETMQGQPVNYLIGISNFAPASGAGITATGAALHIELDPRLSLSGVSGASCTPAGAMIDCTLGDLAPIPRGTQNGTPPAARQILLSAQTTTPLPVGTVLQSTASVGATEPNRHPSTRVTLQRFVVAGADLVVAANHAEGPDVAPGNGQCADATGRCSLRAALAEANAAAGPRTIALSSGLYRLEQGQLQVTGSLTITGLGAGRSEITTGGADRVLRVLPGASLVLRGVTLSGGKVADRGGLLLNGGTTTIEDALLQDGEADGGGGVANDAGATLTLRRVALVGNRATTGAGQGGGLRNLGTATLDTVLLHGNRALAGGAIESVPGAGATLLLQHASVIGNVATGIGGAFSSGSTTGTIASVRNSIIADNQAPQNAVCTATLASVGGNLLSGSLDGCAFVAQPDDRIGLDPGLGQLVATGEGMPELVPASASPAVDAVTTACTGPDLRGRPRPLDGNGDGIAGCDTGAYELAPDSLFASGFE